jgi:SWI/SNF-related matrix-associated actin-dependent regulator 1 of chromatin subfamily A
MNSTIYKGTILKTACLTKYKNNDQSVILIKFPFDRSTLDQVRSLPERRYHSESKFWTCPVSAEAVNMLKGFGFGLDEDLQKFVNNKPHLNTSSKKIKEIEIKGLPGKLRKFQNIGVSMIEQLNGRILLGDEMGLGKTVEALAWLFLHPDKIPVVIVVPASLKLNWLRESQRWLINPFVQLLSGINTDEIKLLGKIIIVNYDILSAWVEKIIMINPQVLICDECHYFKNNTAQRTKAVKKLAKGIPHVLCLSGTPIVNRPVEIYNAVHIIDPSLFSNRWFFLQRYCGAKYNGYGWDFNGATNTQELHDKLTNSIMIRRLKKDVLQDLPDKTYSFVPIELTDENEYKEAESNFINYIQQTKGKAAAERAGNAEILTEIETLKQVAVKNKMKQTIEWIQDFIDSGNKLVVFAIHRFVIDELMKAFNEKTVKIDGSVLLTKRQKTVDKFQTNPNIHLFIGNIKAAGVGITLTAASNVVFLELPWTPGELTQAEDRCHRIGQNDKVNIYYLLANNTIEEQIAELLDKKRKVLDSVLDGKDTEQESLLTQLINKY